MITLKCAFSILILVNCVESFANDSHVKSEILSRKKRFLIFPEGSSFQLVFCNTYPTVFRIGDIFLFGTTAALAWELPQDPYSPFNHKADPLHRRMDSKMIAYMDDDGKVIYRRPYGIRKLIVNPAFVKRSIKREEYNVDRKQIHASKNREFVERLGFHRSTRASLYQKIEAMFQGLGGNGRECLLRTLCIVGKTRDAPQGSFLQEILRATFTCVYFENIRSALFLVHTNNIIKSLPKDTSEDDFDDDLHEYDKAFGATDPCHELYPDCSDPLPMMY